MIQATTRGQVVDGLAQHGVAPGGRAMMDMELEAAQISIDNGMYVTWRSGRNGKDCTRVGPRSRCFCGHTYGDHSFASKKAAYPHCQACTCRAFAFIPQRPEEVGEWWLPRRKGFNVHAWRAKCRCGHGHDEHDPSARRCRCCGCSVFTSNFGCLVCDGKWEDHETVFETARERLMEGRPVGEDYLPLADDKAVQGMVFPPQPLAARPATKGQYAAPKTAVPGSSNRLRPAQVAPQDGEKGVRIMAAASGGALAGQELANRWGKVINPPEWQAAGLTSSAAFPLSAALTAAGAAEARPPSSASATSAAVRHNPASATRTDATAGGSSRGASRGDPYGRVVVDGLQGTAIGPRPPSALSRAPADSALPNAYQYVEPSSRTAGARQQGTAAATVAGVTAAAGRLGLGSSRDREPAAARQQGTPGAPPRLGSGFRPVYD